MTRARFVTCVILYVLTLSVGMSALRAQRAHEEAGIMKAMVYAKAAAARGGI